MKTVNYLNYFKNLKILGLLLGLFLTISGVKAQQKDPTGNTNKYRMSILKEENGKRHLLDTTILATDLEKLKAQPGELQNILREMSPVIITGGNLKNTDVLKAVPGLPLLEKEIRILNLGDSLKLAPDSLRMILEHRVLRSLNRLPDSLRVIVHNLNDNIREQVIIRDSVVLREIQPGNAGGGNNNQINRVNPAWVLTDQPDTLRATNKVNRLIAIRKIIITDIQKKDTALLNKAIPTNNLTLSEDLRIKNLRFYPNPNQGRFTLSFKVPQPGDMAIKIYDPVGREIHREDYQYFAGDYQREINLSGASPGVYFLKIIQGDSALTKKLIIE